jgi:hypothetical protein
MITYYPSNDEKITYGLSSDLSIHLEKSKDNTQWLLSFIERGIPEKSLDFINEYEACLGFLRIAGKTISDIPSDMKVIDYREGAWFLLEQEQELFLDVHCDLLDHNHSCLIKLSSEDILSYRIMGEKSLDILSEKVSSKDSIFHSYMLNEKINAEVDNAIIAFNKNRDEYVKKHYKTLTNFDPQVEISQNIISKKNLCWCLLILIIIGSIKFYLT